MLRKNLFSFIILIALIVLSAIYFFSNRNETFSAKETAFACSDLSSVNAITVRKSDSVFILKKNNNTWLYNSSFIVKPSLMSICYRIFSQVEIKSLISKKFASRIAGKIKRSGVEIKLTDENKIVKHYFVWADTKSRNIFMMMADKEIPFIVTVPSFNGNFTELFRIDPSFWRDLTILHYTSNQINSIIVEQPSNQNQSFKIDMSSADKAVLTDLKYGKIHPFKQEALEAFLFCFRNVNGSSYFDNNSEILKKIEMNKPLYIISISDREGNQKILKIFPKEIESVAEKKSNSNFDVNFSYVLINDKDLVVAKYVEIDPITRDLDFFLQK